MGTSTLRFLLWSLLPRQISLAESLLQFVFVPLAIVMALQVTPGCAMRPGLAACPNASYQDSRPGELEGVSFLRSGLQCTERLYNFASCLARHAECASQTVEGHNKNITCQAKRSLNISKALIAARRVITKRVWQGAKAGTERSSRRCVGENVCCLMDVCSEMHHSTEFKTIVRAADRHALQAAPPKQNNVLVSLEASLPTLPGPPSILTEN